MTNEKRIQKVLELVAKAEANVVCGLADVYFDSATRKYYTKIFDRERGWVESKPIFQTSHAAANSLM